MNADVVVRPMPAASNAASYRRPSPVDAWASARTAGRQRSPLCLATLGMASSSHRNSVQRQRASSSAPTVRFAESVAAASPGVRPASRPAVYPTALLRQIQRRRSRRRQEKLLAIGRLKVRASSAEKSKLEAKKEVTSKRPHEILIHGEKPIVLFRRIARVVAKMVTVCLTMKTYAVEAGLLDRYLVTVSIQAPRDDDKKKKKKKGEVPGKEMEKEKETEESFVFDLDYFLMNKKGEMPSLVRRLMDTNPDDRTDHDIELIGREVWKIPSFRKYSSRLQRMMCRIVRYMRCGKRRVVLRKGHIGYNVYYIYSGSVNVIMEKDDTGVFIKPEVVVLRKGACFGEIALLENTRRNATIVCAEATELLVIDKDDYMRNGLSDQMKEETRLRFEFFRNWMPLANWSDAAIHALSYISRTEDFAYNRVIVEDSQRNEWLWFIAKGNSELLRFVDLEKCTDPLLLESLEKKGFQFMTTAKPVIHRLSKTSWKTNASETSLKARVTPRKCKIAYFSNTGDVIQRGPDASLEQADLRQHTKWQGMPALLFGKSSPQKARKQQLAIRRKAPNTDRTPEPQPNKDVGKGIFLRIDKLVQGQCMGLEPLFPDMDAGRRYAQQRYSLVSQGCTVIHLPRVKFREMAPPDTLHHIAMLLMEDYPHDSELGDKFINKSTWEIYKHGVVEAVVQRQCHSCPSIQNYLRFDAVRDIDGINYTAVNRRDGTPLVSKLRWQPAFGPKKEKPTKRPVTSSASLPPGSHRGDSQADASMSSGAARPDEATPSPSEQRNRDPAITASSVSVRRSSVNPLISIPERPMSKRQDHDRLPSRERRGSVVSYRLQNRRSSVKSATPSAPVVRQQTVRESRHIRLSQIIDLERLLERRRLAESSEPEEELLESNVNYNSSRGGRVPRATFTTLPDEIHVPSVV